ncbi:helix-turn-helix domain-containing protein [Micromonospora andamanensis]|uniref:helix-turn-helix domain-containing protein n=1 Tax=Micromonospora andamanensis TaxID=1287068 RepID=UPI00195248C8|nr:helix-turn-helix transcriptional regulator [Micromonospora andamanensis]GIJ40509.1 hypothetical protein Vwe01_38340 [Micromonospora andamanensis]
MATLDADGSVGEYFAINLRKIREEKGLSQAELAQRIKDLGHSCTQATIWKLEQGHREPKITEVVAIGAALDLWSWKELVEKPATFDVATTLDRWRRRAYELAEQTRAAAAAQMEALVQLAFAAKAAEDAGLSVEWARQRAGWLELTPEVTVLREVLAARVAEQSEDEERDRRGAEEDRLVEQIVDALESSGVPLAIKPEDIEVSGSNSPRDNDVEAAG